MSNTRKQLSNLDSAQTLQGAFNEEDKSFTISGFLVGKVGHKFLKDIETTNVSDDTEVFSYYDDDNLLYKLKIIYTDSNRTDVISGERIE